MASSIYCPSCASKVAREALFSHVEDCQIGPKSLTGLCEISCGECLFRINDQNGDKMVEHCYKTKHSTENLRYDWDAFVRRESARVSDIIKCSVQLLQDQIGTDSIESGQDWRKTASNTSSDTDVLSRSVNQITDTVDIKDVRKLQNKQDVLPENIQENWSGNVLPLENVFRSEPENIQLIQGNSGDGRSFISDPEFGKDSRQLLVCAWKPEASSTKIISSAGLKSQKKRKLSPLPEPKGSKVKRVGLKCERCNLNPKKGPNLKTRLFSHCLNKHSGVELYHCGRCFLGFTSTGSYMSHVDKCDGELIWKANPDDLNTVREVLRDCFPTIDLEQQVKYMEQSAIHKSIRKDSETGVEKIVRQLVEREQPVQEGRRKCRICSGQVRNSSWDILRHAVPHSGLKPFACPKCEERFSSSPIMQKHFTRKCSKGTMENIPTESTATPEDMERVRAILSEAFPETDWNEKLPPGTDVFGLRF